MSTVKLKFRASATPGKQGTLLYQIIHNREVKRIRSRFKLYPDEWDCVRNEIVIPTTNPVRQQTVRQVQNDTQWEMRLLEKLMAQFTHDGTPFSAADIATSFAYVEPKDSVFRYIRSHACRLKSMGRMRCGEACLTALNMLTEYRGGLDLTFDMMDADMMEGCEAHLRARGVTRNTTSFYMRTLRAIYNRAVDDGLTTNRRPFRRVFTSKEKTMKRALAIDDIRRIKDIDLSGAAHLEYARDMFMFSFYARGMAFVDMAYLRKEDRQQSHFEYCRQKTGQRLSVEWTPQMNKIVLKYNDNAHIYMLPIITNASKDAREQYLAASHKINRNLKTIGEMLQLPCRLTMYYSRHSWATIARAKQIPISVISEGLGHDSEATTQIYLDSIKTSVVDAANRLIMDDL